MIFLTDEQRQILQEDGAPLPLLDASAGRCYMVMPVDVFADEAGVFRASVPGMNAVAEAELPSDAAETLAVLLRTMLEQNGNCAGP